MSDAKNADGGPMGTGRLVLWMLVLVLIGTPMVFVLWSAVNEVLLGEADSVSWVLVVPVLLVFLGFLYLVDRVVRRWDARAEPHREERL